MDLKTILNDVDIADDDNLESDLKNNPNVKWFICPVCEEKFVQKCNYKFHINRKNPCTAKESSEE